MLGRLREPSTGPFSSRRSMLLLTVVAFFLFAMPVVMLAVGAIRDATPGRPAQWSFDAFRRAYGDAGTYSVLGDSVLLALGVMVISTVTGLLLAFIVARTDTPLRRLVTPSMMLVIALPPLFYGISWAMLGNPRIGTINSFWQDLTGAETPLWDTYSWSGIVVVTSLKSTAFAYFVLLGPLMAMNRSLEEASRVFGAGRLRTFLRVDVPLLGPSLLGVCILSFVAGLEFFDVPLLLGTPAGIDVFATEIFSQIRDRTPADYGAAGALSLLLAVVVVVLVVVQWRILGSRDFTTVTGKNDRTDRWSIGPWRWAGTLLIVGYITLAVALPMAQLVAGSFQPYLGGGVYSTINYQLLFSEPTTTAALRTTAIVAVVGGLCAILMTLLISYAITHSRSRLRRALEVMTWLPFAMPGIILALGIAWLFVSIPGLRSLYGSLGIVVIGLMISAVPLATRAVQPALRQVGRELEESARVSGARPVRMFFSIVVPLIAPSLLAGWFLVAILVSGNLTIPMLLSTTDSATVPLVVYNLHSQGETSQAAALFVILLGALLVLFVVGSLTVRVISRSNRRRRDRSGPDAPSADQVPMTRTIPVASEAVRSASEADVAAEPSAAVPGGLPTVVKSAGSRREP
ncbi:iron(III) transport system permease protein [Jiangella sp. DSM 45060]|nr:iron(III) transport system permease protein [Jiangella sp. DSM 45060]